MSKIGASASISASNPKILPESFRVRDLTNAISVGNNRRTSNESHSLLSVWMDEKNSPFSHRELMLQGKITTCKKLSQPSYLNELSVLRSKERLTPDAYAALVEIVLNVATVNKEIENNKPLSELTVREKNTCLERFKFYDEHFEWVLSGFANAKFHQEVNEVVGRVKREVHQVLELIRNQSQCIKAEIYPSIGDLRRSYV